MANTTLQRIDSHVPDALRRLTLKYVNKPGIEALLGSHVQQFQYIENALWTLTQGRNLDALQGYGLDYMGTLVSAERGYLSDQGYRAILRGIIGEINSDATPATLISILREVFMASAVFIADADAPGLAYSGVRPCTSMTFGIGSPMLGRENYADVIERFIAATAAGIGVHSIFTFDASGAFAVGGPQPWVKGLADLNDATVIGGALGDAIYSHEQTGGDGLIIDNPLAGYPPLPLPPPPPPSATPPPPIPSVTVSDDVYSGTAPPPTDDEIEAPPPPPTYTYSYIWQNGLINPTVNKDQSYGGGTYSTEADARVAGGVAAIVNKLTRTGTPSAFCYTIPERPVQTIIGITADVYADAPGGVVRMQIDDGPYNASPDFPPAVGLFASGNKLFNSAGAEIKLHGVNIPSLGYSTGGDPNPYSTPPPCFTGQTVLDTAIKAITDYKVNFLRVPFDQAIWLNAYGTAATYKANIDAIVAYAATKNVYVDIELHEDDSGKDFNMPNDSSATALASVATRYKTSPNVIIGILNEPRNATWGIWRNGGTATHSDSSTYHTPGMQSLVNTVRATGFTNALTVSGLDYAFDLTGVASGYAITDSNIIYEAHVYPVKSDIAHWDANITTPAASSYPILIGEFGSDYASEASPYGTPPQFLEVLRKWIALHNYNYAAWSMDAASDPCLISDWCYTLTPYFGAVVVPWLGPATPLVSQSFVLPTAGWTTVRLLFANPGVQNVSTITSKFLNLQIVNASATDTGKVRVNNVGLIVNDSTPAVVDGYTGTETTPATATTGKALYTKGNKFYRASDNSVWMGRGCNSCDTRFDDKQYYAPDAEMATELKRRIGWAMGQGVDFIRLCLEVKSSGDDVMNDQAYLDALKSVVAYIGAQGGWCMVSVWYHYTCSPEPIGQLTDATINVWKKLASAFRGSTHVLFGLCNEPRGNSTQRKRQSYLNTVNNAITAIRQVESDGGDTPHIIVVPGPDNWARSVDWFLTNRATDAAYPYVDATSKCYIAYELHNYETQSEWPSQDGMAAAQVSLPLIIGEFAPDNQVSTQTQADTAALMSFCNTNKVPYTGWTLDFRTPPDMLQDLSSQATGNYDEGTPLKWTDWGLQFINILRAQKSLAAVNKNGT